MEEDIAASGPREVKAFFALGEERSLDIETLSRFSNRFQFPERVRVRRPCKEEWACHFLLEKVCFYEAAFLCKLRFPIHPFIMELLNHFNITPGQLMPNSWRIVIRVDEFTYLYYLKESKEYGYNELVPWVREATIVRGLPLSFWYWKSRFFFVFGDKRETLSNEVCGDIPRLLRRWRAPSLGASFSANPSSFILLHIFCHC